MSIVVLLALVGTSCRDSSAPTSLDVRATISRAQYRAGDSVTVAVEIENTGEGALRIPGGFPAFSKFAARPERWCSSAGAERSR